MAALRASLCAVFMVTVVTSKPICLHDGDDSSKSSESSESTSSEEAATHFEPSQDPLQPNFTETNPPDLSLLPSAADAGYSPAPFNASALPDLEDPQTSGDADALPLMPDDPSQTALGIDISQDMPESDPVQDLLITDTVRVLPDTEALLHPVLTETEIIKGTNQPEVTTTYQGFPQRATPPFPPHVIKPTPLTFSVDPSLPIPMGTALTGTPVCFTFQFVTPEPKPVRGDNI